MAYGGKRRKTLATVLPDDIVNVIIRDYYGLMYADCMKELSDVIRASFNFQHERDWPDDTGVDIMDHVVGDDGLRRTMCIFRPIYPGLNLLVRARARGPERWNDKNIVFVMPPGETGQLDWIEILTAIDWEQLGEVTIELY